MRRDRLSSELEQRALLTALLGVGACAAPAPEAPGVTRSDSAGVEIVANHAPAWPEGRGWTVADQPSLEIGLAEGELPYVFNRIAGAVRLEDGRIVVADGQSNELRFFDRDGRFLTSVGRTGQGPGEYEYLRHVDRCAGDSITAFDISWQLKVYDPTGRLAREERLLEPGTNRTPYQLSCSRSGTFLITGWGDAMASGPPPIGLYRTTAPLALLGSGGEPGVVLGEYPGAERLGTERGSSPHPFGKTTVLSVGDSMLYVGTGDHFEIRVLDFSGTLIRLIRGPEVDRTISAEHLDRYRENRLKDVAPARRPEIERALRDMPMPAAFPAYAELRVDRLGTLWVKDAVRPGAEQTVWFVFDSTGRWLGRVSLPLDLSLTEIGADYVLAMVRDELGVERVRLYRLTRG